ncbi:uncharacterized protein MELLADRAFT_85048 [Melampsora larici-populina 98AG31]|uniref:Uncharacterized protein n=1 Tax=Melampsora larici-populina (strain 98AG31 / pathotype 3-4-7) TaxID=747676 RepID=F4RHA9_MELLP|nr:uncharacterized protein MELLADRAFT_85048 [Melampsora larici-populina 98AG31]EGG08237.1 hypothetical protein MELLADRAFT_85048 [Melampsora larici-populina 98AG31]
MGLPLLTSSFSRNGHFSWHHSLYLCSDYALYGGLLSAHSFGLDSSAFLGSFLYGSCGLW